MSMCDYLGGGDWLFSRSMDLSVMIKGIFVNISVVACFPVSVISPWKHATSATTEVVRFSKSSCITVHDWCKFNVSFQIFL